jgi:hypothetical protein
MSYLEEFYVEALKLQCLVYVTDFTLFCTYSFFVICLFNLDHMFWASFHVSHLRPILSFVTAV